MEYLGVEDITRLKLGDSIEKELSVLFFDIRSFSVHSEMMSTPETFGFINQVLGAAGPVLRRYNGFVDKFIGDAAMVLFEDAGDAVQAGIELYRTLTVNEETRITLGGDPVGIGIGVHTGKMMLGIVGESERLSSTVISENVNFASRLESLTRQTGSGMLISRDTMNAAAVKLRREGEDDGEAVGPNRRFIGMIQAAGVNGVTGVFDILDALPEEARQKRLATKQTFESAVRRFHTRDYRGAAERFIQVLRLDPKDACARICFEEAKKRLANPALPAVFMFDKK
jgi:class 3 adenylate cyclase